MKGKGRVAGRIPGKRVEPLKKGKKKPYIRTPKHIKDSYNDERE